jgi:hypothetical protein
LRWNRWTHRRWALIGQANRDFVARGTNNGVS